MRSLSASLALAVVLPACSGEVQSETPSLFSTSPELVCAEQLDTEVRVTGAGLAPVAVDATQEDGGLALPTLWLDRTAGLDGAEADGLRVDVPAPRWQGQSEMAFDVTPDLGVEPGVYDLYVAVADGQSTRLPSGLSVVAAPTLDSHTPGLLCMDQTETGLTIQGTGFLATADALPTVQVGDQVWTASAVDGCTGVLSPAQAELCTTLDIRFPVGALDPAVHELTVQNPGAAACTTPDPLSFEVIVAPAVDATAPGLACAAQEDLVLTLTGAGFLATADGTLPMVRIGEQDFSADALEDCSALTGPDGGETCSTLTLTVPAGVVDPGVLAVSVTNPAPADCASTGTRWVELVGAPVLESALPEPQCTTQGDHGFTLRGEGFVVLADGTLPSVTFGGVEVAVESADACTPLQGPEGGSSCRSLAVVVADGAVEQGIWDVVVTNPGDTACVSEQPVAVELVPPPVLTGVDHQIACDVQGADTFVLTGSDFIVTRDGVRPSVTVGGYTAEADAASDCTARSGDSMGQSCTTLTFVVPAGAVGAGLQSVTVTNPGSSVCSSTETVEIEFVEAPVLASVTDDLVCDAEGDVALELAGTGFVVLADGTLPGVSVAGGTATTTAASGCTALTGPAGGETCTGLSVVLTQGSAGAGLHDVVVTNPEPAACASTESVPLQVVGEPVVASIDPGLTCDTDAASSLTVSGSGFLVLADGTLPGISIGSWSGSADSATGCTALGGTSGGELCTGLVASVPAGTFGDGAHAVQVTNPAPAACDSEDAVSLVTAAAPTVTGVVDALACDEQGDVDLEVEGTGFVVAPDGSLPSVTVDGTTVVADAATGCTPLPGGGGGESCTRVRLTLPAGAVGAGVHSVSVTNPDPVACDATGTAELELVPEPVLAAVDEGLVCGAQETTTWTLSGSDFLVTADGDLPVVTVGGWTGSATAATGCVSLTGPDGGESCTGLTVEVSPGLLYGGVQSVSVVNPDPAGCETRPSVPVEVVDPPSVVTVTPPDTCGGGSDQAIDLAGSGFLVLADGTLPTVHVGTAAYTADSVSGCTALTGPEGGQVCTDLSLTYVGGDLSVGTHDLFVENPGVGTCTSMEDTRFGIAEPPSISAVSPAATCPTGGVVSVLGSGFTSGTQVTIGGLAASSVTFVSATELEVEVPPGLPTNSYQDVTVSNFGCGSDTLVAGLYISGVPSVFYFDPSIVYTGIQLEGTAYISSVDTVGDVWLIESATGLRRSLSFTHTTGANQVKVTVPSGLAEGYYDLWVENAFGCSASLEDAWYAESDLTVTVDDVEPSMGWTGEDTAVEVTGLGFVDVPRLYLNPSTTGTASGLSSVRYRTSSSLNAVIPQGLTPDVYDLIVINPDGTIGLLSSAFEVSTDPVPRVDAVAPASVSTSDGTITITGDDFRSPSVEIQCVAASTGAESTAPVSITSSTSSVIEATIPSSSYSNGDVCIVRVTNADGTYFDYSAISITSPSYNLYGFEVGPSMTQGRRAASSASGRATTAERYIYAFGGDGGTTSSALSSVEAIDIDQFGGMGTWRILETSELPTALTMAGLARIGRFFYLVGGHDGFGATDAVWRAQILDPRETPTFSGLEMDYGDGVTGMTAGTYIYRIAALYPASYDTNPGGQSLASDPIVINVPSVPDLIELTVEWDAVSDASGYRVYRTPTAGAGSGTEEWLGDVTGGSSTSFTDTGAATDPTVLPLEDGSLGAWYEVVSLSTPRQGPGVGVGVDPSDDTIHYIYAAGGLDGSGTALDTIEYLGVVEVSEQEHALDATWTASANILDEPRSNLGAWSVASDLNPSVPTDENWLYFGGGNPTGTRTKSLNAGVVTAGGELGSWAVVASLNKARSGFGVAVASDQLYAFGGHNGVPNSTSDSCGIDGAAGPPSIGSCNAGAALNTGRYLLSATQESAQIYVIGGDVGTGKGSTSVEYGPW